MARKLRVQERFITTHKKGSRADLGAQHTRFRRDRGWYRQFLCIVRRIIAPCACVEALPKLPAARWSARLSVPDSRRHRDKRIPPIGLRPGNFRPSRAARLLRSHLERYRFASIRQTHGLREALLCYGASSSFARFSSCALT